MVTRHHSTEGGVMIALVIRIYLYLSVIIMKKKWTSKQLKAATVSYSYSPIQYHAVAIQLPYEEG